MEEEVQPLTTDPITGEPVPVEGMTKEQGDLILEKLDILVNNQSQLIVNTTPSAEPTETGTAVTGEQMQVLIGKVDTMEQISMVLTISIALVFVARFCYRLISETFFGY